jgi:hypothetical protein
MQCKKGIYAQQYTSTYYDTLTWEEEEDTRNAERVSSMATGNAHTKWISSKTLPQLQPSKLTTAKFIHKTSSKYSSFRVCRKKWSHRNTAGIQNRLWVGHPWKCGSVPDRYERIIFL